MMVSAVHGALACLASLSSCEVLSLDCEALLPSGLTQSPGMPLLGQGALSPSPLLAAAQVTPRVKPVHPELRKQTLGCFLCCVVSSGRWEVMARVAGDGSILRGGL